MQQQTLQPPASAHQVPKARAAHSRAVIQRQTLQMNTPGRDRLDVAIVDEGHAVEIDHAQVGSARLDLAQIDRFVVAHFLLARDR